MNRFIEHLKSLTQEDLCVDLENPDCYQLKLWEAIQRMDSTLVHQIGTHTSKEGRELDFLTFHDEEGEVIGIAPTGYVVECTRKAMLDRIAVDCPEDAQMLKDLEKLMRNG